MCCKMLICKPLYIKAIFSAFGALKDEALLGSVMGGGGGFVCQI